jgi:anti-sigma factor RsiW
MTMCQTIQGWVSASLDGEATPEEFEAVERHLDVCGFCRQEAERLDELKVLVAKGLRGDPGPVPAPWFAAKVAAQAKPKRPWRVALPALAAAVAGLALAWFLVARPTKGQLLSVYELKPVEPAPSARIEVSAPPPVDHYLKEHVIQASSAPPIDSQGLVEYVGFHR